VIALAGNVDWSAAIVLFIVLLVSLTAHEAAHALVAKLGGDLTAYRSGQVTLNPLPHIQREPMGMVVVPLLSIYMTGGQSCIGFASAPIDPILAYHHPRRAALVSAAGPLANFVLAALAFGVLWIVGRPESSEGAAVRRIAITFLVLNVLLGVFNLFPVPPLDGAGVLAGLVLPMRRVYDNLRRIPYLPLLLLVAVAFYVMPVVMVPVLRVIVRWLPYPF